jgi:hypothetical protein
MSALKTGSRGEYITELFVALSESVSRTGTKTSIGSWKFIGAANFVGDTYKPTWPLS